MKMDFASPELLLYYFIYPRYFMRIGMLSIGNISNGRTDINISTFSLDIDKFRRCACFDFSGSSARAFCVIVINYLCITDRDRDHDAVLVSPAGNFALASTKNNGAAVIGIRDLTEMHSMNSRIF